MVEINWTFEAELWLKEIYEYIKKDNPGAARRTIELIHMKAQILYEFPEIGYKYQHAGRRNIRILLYGHYRIAYLIKDENNIDIYKI